jgi:glycosyltransferase involved in cell wall biosynthesis
MSVAVIATVYNEAASIQELLDSLAIQTLRPDEVVIADAGSTDGTLSILEASSLPGLQVVHAPGNRSMGRNAAISAATSEWIATTDGGCVAEPNWLEALVAPLARGDRWVAGFYRPQGDSDLSTCIGLVIVYVAEEVLQDPDAFLPSARSMAFDKALWKQVGGFPERVDFAEDTLFGHQMRAVVKDPAVAIDAIVRWKPPRTLGALAGTAYRWGVGDAEAGIRGWSYKRILVGYGGSAFLTVITGAFAPAWVWLGPFAVLIDTVHRTRFKFRWAPKPAGWVLVPIAHIVATYSSLTGFLIGYVKRRRSRGSAAVADDGSQGAASPPAQER